MADVSGEPDLRISLRDGDTVHRITRRVVQSAAYLGTSDDVALTCQCGTTASTSTEHEVIWYALHLVAPPGTSAAELAGIHAHAVQAIARAQKEGST